MSARCIDLLDHWHSHGTITRAQFEAGRRFRRIFDAADLGAHATLDLQTIPGGGFARPPLPDAQVTARDELKRMRARLGHFDFSMLCRCIGRGEPVGPETAERADLLYWSRRLRDALAQLGVRVAIEV